MILSFNAIFALDVQKREKVSLFFPVFVFLSTLSHLFYAPKEGIAENKKRIVSW